MTNVSIFHCYLSEYLVEENCDVKFGRIESKKTSFNTIEINIEEMKRFEDKLVSIGKGLLDVTKIIDRALQGMILNTYICCLLTATTTLYAASSVFFNRNTGMASYFISFCSFLMTALSSLRLISHTNAGQHLASAMEVCGGKLDEILMIRCKDEQSRKIKILTQNVKDRSTSPIHPFSAFSLSNNTLVGTFATILTYLIVLVQFKAAEDEVNTKTLTDIREILQQMIQNQSNIG